MMANFPELCCTSSWMSGEFSSRHRFPSFLWRIPTLPEMRVNPVFSILMSYLTSSSRPDIHKNSIQRLRLLFDSNSSKDTDEKKNYKKMSKKVVSYNPFRNNRCLIFSREDLELALRNFEQILTNGNVGKKGESNIFETASEVLECSIIVYKSEEKNGEHFQLYPNGSIFSKSRRLYIFQKTFRNILSENPEEKCSFFYGLTPEIAFSLRKEALNHILKTAKISDDEIEHLQRTISYNENFLISLLKNSCDDILIRIYNFPYIAMKLSEAGFNTDPLKTDEKGLSAFFYCMSFPNTSILRLLYNYSVNNVQVSDCTIRNPKIDVLNNLKKINNTIKRDTLRSHKYSTLNARQCLKALKLNYQILQFNDYQIDTVNDMLNLKETDPREIMIVILNNYCKYFYLKPKIVVTRDLNLFKHYIKCNEYYSFLDTFMCLLFFDYFISLTTFINEKNLDVYVNAMSSLLLCILGDKFFPMFRHGIQCNNCKRSEDECEEMSNKPRFIPFCYRQDFFRNAEKLKQELTDSLQDMNAKTKKSIDICRRSLMELPEISDDFISNRISNYLSSVKNLSLKNDTVKNMLVAERTLQVFGEVLQNQTMSECHVKHLTSSLFSKDLEHQMCQLRDHCLSKYRASSVQGRIVFERSNKHFEKLQEDFKKLSNLFIPIHASQQYRAAKYLIKYGEEILFAQYSNSEWNLNNESEQVLHLQKREYLRYEDAHYTLIKNMIKYIINIKNDVKFKILRSNLNALTFLFENIVLHHNNDDFAFLEDSSKSIKQFILQIEKEGLNPDKKKICDNILSTCLLKFSNSKKRNSEPLELGANFSIFERLFTEIHEANVFEKEEENCIRHKITNYLKNSNDAIFYLQTKASVSPKDLKEKLNAIIISEKDRKYINKNFTSSHQKALKCLESANTLEEIDVLENEINLTTLFVTLSEKEKYRTMFFRLSLSHGLRKKVYQIMNQKVYFLINRIDKLEEILIKDDERVSYLWNRGKSEGVRNHAKLLIAQRYKEQRDTRAAVEMLLFDCWNILKSDELKELWEKATCLFSGVNLRDVLAHGNPVLEIIGSFLDPSDLPSAMVDKVVELIDDRPALSALSEFWYRRKINKYMDFMEAVKSNATSEDSSLCKKIMSCTRWQKYVELLPMER